MIIAIVVAVLIAFAALVSLYVWYRVALKSSYEHGFAEGHQAGQQDERSSEEYRLRQAYRHALDRGAEAQEGLSYLYQRTRRQLDAFSADGRG